MDLSQRIDVRHELHLTTEMRQGISVLQMSAAELSDYVQQCVEENPFLDDDDWQWPQHSLSPDAYAKTVSAEAVSEALERSCAEGDASRMVASPYDERPFASQQPSLDNREIPDGRFLADSETLADHLLAQLALQPLTPQQREAGTYIIESLDNDGYLHVPLDAVAEALGISHEEALGALGIVQRLEPLGVGARSLGECLRLQLEARGHLSALAKRVVEDHLSDFEKKSPAQIARNMGVTLEALAEVLSAMRQCNPHPGAQFGRACDPIWPEVVVEASPDGGYAVRLQDFYLPHLRVNEYYRTLACESCPPVGAHAKGARRFEKADAYLAEKLKEAETLIANINYRKATLYKVACCIVELQSSFFDEGFACIRPLTMEHVARLTQLSESTISRTAKGNYMQTPRGVFELRFFFQPVAACSQGREISQASVKHRISQLVESEDSRRPLSDQDLADALAREGAAVSRRTVNKYRVEMGIPAQAFRRRA